MFFLEFRLSIGPIAKNSMSSDDASDIALLEKVLFRLASHAADDDSGMESTINRVLVPILPSVAKVRADFIDS